MTEELKPCPFCGSDDLQNNGHYVECCNCHATGPSLYPVPDSKKAREKWNTRVEPNEIPGWLREELINAVCCAKDDETKGWNDALGFVLSLKREEEE